MTIGGLPCATTDPMPGRQQPVSVRGFTLIELMVTVAILAILATVAAPSFNDAILSNKLAAYANDFVASAQVARGEAVKRNAKVRICRSQDGTSCVSSGSFQGGWIVFADVNNNGTVDTGDTVIQYQQALSTEYHMTSTNYSLIFEPSGGLTSAAVITLCRASPSAGRQEREITVSMTGRPTVKSTKTGVCS